LRCKDKKRHGMPMPGYPRPDAAPHPWRAEPWGAPRGEGNGNFRHGFWTREAMKERRWANEMVELFTKGIDE
jgi:hypothetical protein